MLIWVYEARILLTCVRVSVLLICRAIVPGERLSFWGGGFAVLRQGFDSPNNGGANLVSFEEQFWFRFLLDCPHEEGERRCEKRHETRGGVRTEGGRARRKLEARKKGGGRKRNQGNGRMAEEGERRKGRKEGGERTGKERDESERTR